MGDVRSTQLSFNVELSHAPEFVTQLLVLAEVSLRTPSNTTSLYASVEVLSPHRRLTLEMFSLESQIAPIEDNPVTFFPSIWYF